MAKFNNVIAFLDTEPPRDSKHLKKLFVARESLLSTTVDRLKSIRREDPQRVLAITGLARVGKSHLLKRALLDVKRSFHAIIEMKITPGQSGGAAVLREMLNQTVAQLHNVVLKKGITAEDDSALLEPLHEIMRLYSEAISGHASEIQIQEASTLKKSLKQRLGASFKTSGLVSLFGGPEIGLRARRETGEQESQTVSKQVKLRPLPENALCDLVSLGHELLRQVQPNWQTLLVIDDFDVLHRSKEGSFDPVPLMQQLFNLAQTEGLHVITTVREDTYHQHGKVFYQVAKVKPMGQDASLVEAYQRRVTAFHRASKPLFSDELVEDVAQRTEGRIGIFFNWLKDLHDDGVAEDLPGWFSRQWDSASHIERGAADCILKAVNSGMLQAAEAATLRKTSLMRFVLEDYSSFDSIRVDPLVHSLLLEQLEAPRQKDNE